MQRPRIATAFSVSSLLMTLTLVTAGCQLGQLWPSGEAALETIGGLASEATVTEPASAIATVPIEVLFLRYAETDPVIGEELWTLADEQFLDLDLRRRLLANGLRVGLLTGDIPGHIAARFQGAGPQTTDFPAAEEGIVRRVIQAPTDGASELLAGGSIRELVLLEHDARSTAERFQGRTYHDAKAIFSLEVGPASDGRILLEATPMLRHGPVERNWIATDGAFRLEAGQRRAVMDRLRWSVPLSTRDLLVIGVAGESASNLGDACFRDMSGRHDGLKILAIRPLHTATDPMFHGSETAATVAESP
jgi:hypothetical protein